RPPSTLPEDRTGRGLGSGVRGKESRASRAGLRFPPAFNTPVRLRVWAVAPGVRPGSEPRNLPREPLARQRHDPAQLVVAPESRGVEAHRVGRRPKRRYPPRRVGPIPGRERLRLAAQPLRVDLACRALARLGEPPPGALLGARRQKHLRSEEHTSELQSRFDLVCRLLLEKKKKTNKPAEH